MGVESGAVFGKLTAGTRFALGGPISNRVPWSPVNLQEVSTPAGRGRVFARSKRDHGCRTFSVPSRSLPTGLRLWRHFSGLGCHLRVPTFFLNQTPRPTLRPPHAPPGVCSPPTVVAALGRLISEKSWTSCVIAIEGEGFPTRTLIRRYLQTKGKRDGERGPTYHVCSHQGKVTLRSGELSVRPVELPVLKPVCLSKKRRPNNRFLCSDHSGFHDARRHLARFKNIKEPRSWFNAHYYRHQFGLGQEEVERILTDTT